MENHNKIDGLYKIGVVGNDLCQWVIVTEKKTGRKLQFLDFDSAIAFIERNEKGVTA